MKFRFHRGSLSESLKTQFEFKDKEDLINKINTEFPELKLNNSNFKCSYYEYDSRIVEEVYVIQIESNKGKFVIGFSDCVVE